MSDLARIQTHGHTLTFRHTGDHLGRILASGTLYEALMLAWIAAHIPPDGLYVDVGACLGTHSVFFEQVCGVTVLAFEPNPEAYTLLIENLDLNGSYGRVQPVPLGLSEHLETKQLVHDAANLGRTRLLPGWQVACLPLDLWTMHERVTLVKLDCEGMELDALRGMQRLLSADAPHLFIECHEANALRVVEHFLGPFGYTRRQRFNATPTYYFAPADTTPEAA